jgi:hypothetical protein
MSYTLALSIIDSKLKGIQDLKPSVTRGDLFAEGRLDGAEAALLQLRERIVRAMGPPAE